MKAECTSDAAVIDSPGYVGPYFPAVLPDGLTLVSHELDSRVLFCSGSGEQWLEVWVARTWQGPGGMRIQTELGCAYETVGSSPPVWTIEYQYGGESLSYKKLTVRAENLSENEVFSAIESIPLLADEC